MERTNRRGTLTGEVLNNSLPHDVDADTAGSPLARRRSGTTTPTAPGSDITQVVGPECFVVC